MIVQVLNSYQENVGMCKNARNYLSLASNFAKSSVQLYSRSTAYSECEVPFYVHRFTVNISGSLRLELDTQTFQLDRSEENQLKMKKILGHLKPSSKLTIEEAEVHFFVNDQEVTSK